MKIPKIIVAGDTIRWTDSNLSGIDPLTGLQTDFLPGTHTLTHAIRGADLLNVVATASGDDFVSTITAGQSLALTPGQYVWQATIALSTQWRLTLDTGTLQVAVDLVTTEDGYDGRSTAEKQLEAVTNAITTLLAGGAVQSYGIQGRNLSRYSLAELTQLQAQLRARVQREKGGMGSVLVQFNPPR